MARPARFKEAIYQSATRLFGERGLSDTGIREIAHAAGVSEAALYRHWRGKNELAREIFLRGMSLLYDRLLQSVPGDGPAQPAIQAVVRVLFEAFDEHGEIVNYLLMNQAQIWRTIDRSKPNPVSFWLDLLRARAGQFDLPPSLAADILGPITLGMILRPSIAAAYGSLPLPLAQHIEPVTTAICRVLGIPPEAAPA